MKTKLGVVGIVVFAILVWATLRKKESPQSTVGTTTETIQSVDAQLLVTPVVVSTEAEGVGCRSESHTKIFYINSSKPDITFGGRQYTSDQVRCKRVFANPEQVNSTASIIAIAWEHEGKCEVGNIEREAVKEKCE